MGSTPGSFSPVTWICWRPIGGIGLKAAAKDKWRLRSIYGQPGNCVIWTLSAQHMTAAAR
jgi:hypothetical protein